MMDQTLFPIASSALTPPRPRRVGVRVLVCLLRLGEQAFSWAGQSAVRAGLRTGICCHDHLLPVRLLQCAFWVATRSHRRSVRCAWVSARTSRARRSPVFAGSASNARRAPEAAAHGRVAPV